MAASFLQQRLYPTMRLGTTLSVGSNRSSEVHCRQSDFDSACGSHCAAMVLALLGKLKGPTRLSRRRTGLAGRLWKAAQHSYFEGTDEIGLAEMIEGLNADLTVRAVAGPHKKIATFVEAELAAGGLAILSFRTPNHSLNHWAGCVGVEGHQTGSTFKPHAFLLLDPSLPEPSMCGYNARMEKNSHPVAHSTAFINYVPNSGRQLAVTLTSAVGIRNK